MRLVECTSATRTGRLAKAVGFLGQNHADARALLRRAEPSLESALGTLLAMKTDAGYGAQALSAHKLLAAQRAARKLVEAALRA
ncbi:hypothetical protein [Antiquaquibacter soli]|uniref:Uncharacterized protein n=1 Tax=Antiquaquibacter soli TaxID=3064523 RepID=A0ABT9BRB3_9MICO|nr:hypothetical protein [Protaetiibacter sp. WY-16]MDO7883560.1 hypothetical protein [Protaetiibacter sp. WY-16]